MAITAAITLTATITGGSEGGSNALSIAASNTSAVDTITLLTLTTVNGTAAPVVVPSSGSFLLAIPPSGASAYRMTGSTAEVGVSCSTGGPSFLSVVGGSTYYFYVAPTGAAFTLRVLVL